MTAYFDNMGTKLGAIERELDFDGIREWELTLVHDCTVAAMMPGFPEDIKREIHLTVLEHGVFSLPVNAPEKDFESFYDHVRFMNQLQFDLHTHFHDVARLRLGRFTDDPRVPLMCIYAVGEEEREELVEQMKAK